MKELLGVISRFVFGGLIVVIFFFPELLETVPILVGILISLFVAFGGEGLSRYE